MVFTAYSLHNTGFCASVGHSFGNAFKQTFGEIIYTLFEEKGMVGYAQTSLLPQYEAQLIGMGNPRILWSPTSMADFLVS